MPDVGQPALHLGAHGGGGRVRDVLHVQRDERVDDDQKRQRVHQETEIHRLWLVVAPPGEHGDRGAEQQRPEHARDVELDRVERDRVRQVFLVDERGNERLVRRAAECLREARDEGQDQDVPDLDHAEEHQQGQRAGGAHLDVLRGQERPAAITPVGEHTADEREEHDRQLLQERVEAEEKRGVCQREDEPVLRNDLHPGPDARGAGPEPLDAEIAVGEGRQHPPQRLGAK